MIEAARRHQLGVDGVGAARRPDDEHPARLQAIQLLAERGHQARARLAGGGRRQQVLERERLGLVQEEDGLALAAGDSQDFLEQLAGVGAELRRQVEQLHVIEDRARRGGQRAGELGFTRAGGPVEQHALGRRDAPALVGFGAGQREREAAQQLLGRLEPAHLVERHLGVDLGLDTAGEVTEFLAELREDVLEAPLQRPLQIVGRQP
jgi:hypothetical protein